MNLKKLHILQCPCMNRLYNLSLTISFLLIWKYGSNHCPVESVFHSKLAPIAVFHILCNQILYQYHTTCPPTCNSLLQRHKISIVKLNVTLSYETFFFYIQIVHFQGCCSSLWNYLLSQIFLRMQTVKKNWCLGGGSWLFTFFIEWFHLWIFKSFWESSYCN